MMRTIAALLFLVWTSSAFAATTGIVFSTAGEPVTGAQVAAYRPEPPDAMRARLAARAARTPLATATTDEHGAFTIDVAATGVLELVVTRDGYAPERDVALARDDVVFELRPAKARTGHVTANGKPVADALVVALSPEHAIWQTRTGARGEYVIPDPRGWASAILVVHPDFAVHQENARIGGFQMNVTLVPGDRVTGTVLTAKGAPAENARLLVNGMHAGTTNAEGKFVLPHVPPTAAMIHATSGGATGRAPRAGKTDLTIRLGDPRSITGTVRDASKRPLPGAYVVAWASQLATVTTVTDEKGTYVIDGLDPADYRVIVHATKALVFGESRAALVSARSERADFTATPSTALRGTVVDERKRPVAGATVSLSVAMMPPLYAFVSQQHAVPVKTGRDGRFVLPWNEEFSGYGIQFRLQALRRGYAIAVTEALDPKADSKPFTIVLPDGVELAGTVVDTDGKPIAGAGIVAMEEPFGASALPLETLMTEGTGHAFVETDAEGKFSLRVNSKPHDLAAGKESFAAARAGSVTPDGKPLRLVLERGVEIRGKVVRKGSSEIPEVFVTAQSDDGVIATRQVEADGAFRIDGLRAGDYTVELFSMRGEPGVEKRVTAPADNVVLELPAVVELRGRVLDEATGDPIAVAYTVSAGTEDFLAKNFGAGEPFALPVSPGSVTVKVQAPGYAPQSQEARIEEGKPAELTFKLTRGRTISGRIREENGTPIENATVSINGNEEFSMDAPASDANGSFALSGISSEALTLEIVSDRHVERRVEVAAGDDDPHLDIVLSRGIKARGRVVSSEGQPVPNASVGAMSMESEGFRHATTDSTGAFVMEGLAAGRHEFRVTHQELGTAELTDVDPAAAEVVITMKPASGMGAVHGKVTGFAGSPWQYGMVVSDSQQPMATVNRDGTFRLERVPAGEIELRGMFSSASGERRSTPAVKATVVAGADTEVNLVLRDDIVVRGVVTENGQPVAYRNVLFQSGGGFWSARTSDTGTYAVTGLEPGLYNVMLEDRRQSFSKKLQVTESATFDIRIELARLTGRVIDAAGVPIAGAEIDVAGERNEHVLNGKSDAHGAFDLSVQKGSYTVTASREGFTTAVRRIESDGTPLTITLARGNALPVRLLDGRSGRFLNGYVVATDADGVVYRPTEAKDFVHNLPVPPGAYRVSASADGYASQSVRVTVPATTEVRIPLTPGGKLVIQTERAAAELVKLVMPSGEEYVQCHCNGIAEIRLSGTTTTVEHVAPGSYTMRVLDEQGRVKASYPVTIVEGQATVAEVHVPE